MILKRIVIDNDKNIFEPMIGTDMIVSDGCSRMISTKHMAITCMEKFKNKSFEELRLENYKWEFTISKENNQDVSEKNESNQLNAIKDLVDQLVNTSCKLMSTMNQISLNSTSCAANKKQANKNSGSSLPPSGFKFTPSSIPPLESDPFFANFIPTSNPTTVNSTNSSTKVTNSSQFNSQPKTDNFPLTPTTNSFFKASLSPMVNDTTTFSPILSNNNFLSRPNTNPTTTTSTTCVSSPFTNFSTKQSLFNKTSTANTKFSFSNPTFSPPTTTSSIFNPTAGINLVSTTNSTFTFSTPNTTSTSSIFNKTPVSNQSTFPSHSCWSNSSSTNSSAPPPVPTCGIFPPFPPFSLDNNAKNSTNFPSTWRNISFPLKTQHVPLFKTFSSQAQFSSTNKAVDSLLPSISNTKDVFAKSESGSSTSQSNPTIQPPTLKSNSTLASISEDNLKTKGSHFINSSVLKKDKKKELNDDEFVSSIVNCIESLKKIIFEARKSKLIGVCEKFNTEKTNLLKSALTQLRVMSFSLFYNEKSAFIGESSGIVNGTIKDNILNHKPFNAQLYYGAIVLCCLKEDIDSLPLGDLTQVGENGVELSDAQKQKIAFARELYADQNIYFLYNAFNKIDSKDARFIFETLILGALKEKVIILMDDKFSYFSHCHEIYVLNQGKIAELRDYKSLMKTNIFVASLVENDDSKDDATEDTTIDDQSLNKSDSLIASVSQLNDTLEVNNTSQNIQLLIDEVNVKLDKIIQKDDIGNIQTEATFEEEIESNECSAKSVEIYSELIDNTEKSPSEISKIQKDNEISIQQGDNQEKQFDEPKEDGIDGSASSNNVENDEDKSHFDFEIC